MRALMRRMMVVMTAALPAACVGHPTIPVAQSLQFAVDRTEHAAWLYESSASTYLTSLRTRYDLQAVVAGSESEMARVRRMSRWVRQRWEHNGDNVATPADPISILEKAATGQRFRCVEYSIVLAGALNAIGIPSRVLGLKTADVETREVGAGHVVTEAWLADQQRWVMVDGQWDVIPMLGSTPLSAVDLQRALAAHDDRLTVESISGTKASTYFAWVTEYLYYFDALLDQRPIGVPQNSVSVMLVPLGAPNPKVFQRKYSLGNVRYTNNEYVFSAAPGNPSP
jgi:transglutaminase-like putative cysteine protease